MFLKYFIYPTPKTTTIMQLRNDENRKKNKPLFNDKEPGKIDTKKKNEHAATNSNLSRSKQEDEGRNDMESLV